MKKLPVLLLCQFMVLLSAAQGLSKADYTLLQKKEDSLRKLSVRIIQGITAEDRLQADSVFTRMLVRSLKTPYSFQYPFDSFEAISVLCSPDSVFRIFTWQLVINEAVIRQHGAIQMRTPDGSLKLFGLIDRSDNTSNMADTIADNNGWMGAIYYKLVQKSHNGRNYYTLLGFDENGISSSKKIIEVLHFENGQPVFGGRYFNFNEKTYYKQTPSRYIMEYKKEAGPRLNYDADLDMIVVEHLVSESNEPQKKWTLVGDGDYEGFKWAGGQWVHVDKIFTQVTPDGQPPVPNPILNPAGDVDERKLKGAEPAEDEKKPAKKKGKGTYSLDDLLIDY
jgi:hypothetical protein